MYHVSFPGFGINVTVNPMAFQIGGHDFAWYGIIIAAAFLLAFFYTHQKLQTFSHG